MRTDTFTEGQEVIEIIESNGFEAYFVGGCVRDFLLNNEIKDIDIATSATPDEIQRIFDKVIPVGIEHGTVIVRHRNVSYEVTTFRLDGQYSDQRHPDDVVFVRNIKEDLKRRDFTINALAMKKDGEIIDLFEGKNDLHDKLIRAVGNPDKRFTEDPLRIIRALRFSSQLGFSIENNTLLSMKKLNDQVRTVAVERLTNECTKLFQGHYVSTGIRYLLKAKVDHYLPIFKNSKQLFKKLPQKLTPFKSFAEVVALFYYLDNQYTIPEWIREWKCSNDVKREAINLYESVKYFELHGLDPYLVYKLNPKYDVSFVHLIHVLFPEEDLQQNMINEKRNELQIKTRHDLAINGHDVIEMFSSFTAGPWIHQLIENIEREVVMNRLKNDKLKIKEWIICHPPVVD